MMQPSKFHFISSPSSCAYFLIFFDAFYISRDSAVSFLTKARNLTTQDGLPCDPFVVVECCGKRYQTDTKEAKAMFVSWNEAPDRFISGEEIACLFRC